jgi:hypothetical protein
METVVQYFLAVFTHEYFLLLYGLFLWHLIRWYRASSTREKGSRKFSNKKWWLGEKNDVLISLAFAPLIIVFDDEILEFYNAQFEHKFENIEKWMYLLGGFIIDRALSYIVKPKRSLEPNELA